ncbi:MAG: DNA-processing protein DprA [Candidatus Zixiibacteriota bacterium]
MTSNEQKERLTDSITLLNVPGVGRGRYWRLVSKFGSPSAVLEASIVELEAVPDIGHTVAVAVKNECCPENAREIAARIFQLGWVVLYPGHPEYPKLLKEIPDLPPLLFRIGETVAEDEKMIGIVGTRHASERGRVFAFNLAAKLVEAGIVVVSGMAEGIDSSAHKGALEAGGRTVAVWGTSLDIVYPPANKLLAKMIAEKGCIYSEYFPDTGPNPAFFPERNRIISGLSEGVVVVEAGKKSGALITARQAIEQGRELFAVPGWPDSPRSIGSNSLIKQGAGLITEVEDIFRQLPRLKGEISAKNFKNHPNLTDAEKDIISLLSAGPRQIDQLARESGRKASEIMELVLAMELKGVLQEISGKRFIISE